MKKKDITNQACQAQLCLSKITAVYWLYLIRLISMLACLLNFIYNCWQTAKRSDIITQWFDKMTSIIIVIRTSEKLCPSKGIHALFSDRRTGLRVQVYVCLFEPDVWLRLCDVSVCAFHGSLWSRRRHFALWNAR